MYINKHIVLLSKFDGPDYVFLENELDKLIYFSIKRKNKNGVREWHIQLLKSSIIKKGNYTVEPGYCIKVPLPGIQNEKLTVYLTATFPFSSILQKISEKNIAIKIIQVAEGTLN